LESLTQGYKPKIVYCLVDRNVQHRLFSKENAHYINPGSGTLVDEALVEIVGDRLYDFFLIPHSATVATAQPVFFRVAYNTSAMTKKDFEHTTYHLCYNYYNF
ncbi:MAG: Piwi domain-containing protein, partial [Flammeovirgaceae bacterium]